MHTSGMTRELQTLNILPVQKSSRLQCCQLSDIQQSETCLLCSVCARLSVSECAVPGGLAQPSPAQEASVLFSSARDSSAQNSGGVRPLISEVCRLHFTITNTVVSFTFPHCFTTTVSWFVNMSVYVVGRFHFTIMLMLINKELTQKLKSSSFTPPTIVLNPSVIPWNTKEHILKNVRATLYSSSEWGMTVQKNKK